MSLFVVNLSPQTDSTPPRNRKPLGEGKHVAPGRPIEAMRRDIDQGGQIAAMDQFQQRAWDILSGKEARDAFDLDADSFDSARWS